MDLMVESAMVMAAKVWSTPGADTAWNARPRAPKVQDGWMIMCSSSRRERGTVVTARGCEGNPRRAVSESELQTRLGQFASAPV